MSHNQKLGKQGEAQAELFLQARGYKILAKNWRSGRLEIDLVAELDSILVFVEVKTRMAFPNPEIAVSVVKQRRIAAAARKWLSKESGSPEIRFDIIAINGEELTHFEDAFFPCF